MSIVDEKKSMSEEVYDILKSEILENKLKPGEKLVEMEISKRLNVSRTHVREALKQLEQERFVTNFPRKGSIVSEISVHDAIEIYEVREYLEGLLIKQLCLNVSRRDIKELEIIVDDMEKTISKNDRPNLYKLHSEWTEKIVELSSNEFLKSQINVVYENLERLRSVSLYKWEHMVEAYNETKNILEAIIDGDEVKAEKLARTHVINAKNRFIENMSAKKD